MQAKRHVHKTRCNQMIWYGRHLGGLYNSWPNYQAIEQSVTLHYTCKVAVVMLIDQKYWRLHLIAFLAFSLPKL